MTISQRTATGLTASSDTTSPYDTLTYTLPTGHSASDFLIAFYGGKPFGTVPGTPSEYSARSGGANGSTASGADTGSVYSVAFTKVHDGSESNPTSSMSGTTTPAMVAMHALYSSASGTAWSVASTYGDDSTTTGTTVSCAGAASLDFAVGDMLVVCFASNNDRAAISGGTVSASGITFGTFTQQLGTTTTGTSDDGQLSIWTATVASGSGTVTPTFTATSQNNYSSGRAIFLRVREPQSKSGSVTGSSASSGAVAGGKGGKGSTAGSTSTTGTTAGKKQATGSVTGSTASSGTVTGTKSGEAHSGSVTGSTATTGTAAGSKNGTGSATGTSAAAGSTHGAKSAFGAIAGSTTSSGTESGSKSSTGTVSGSTASSGTVTGQPSQNFSGSVTGTSASAGSAAGSKNGTGTTSGDSASNGQATGSAHRAGSVDGTTTSTGSIGGGGKPSTEPAHAGGYLAYRPAPRPAPKHARGRARGFTFCLRTTASGIPGRRGAATGRTPSSAGRAIGRLGHTAAPISHYCASAGDASGHVSEPRTAEYVELDALRRRLRDEMEVAFLIEHRTQARRRKEHHARN